MAVDSQNLLNTLPPRKTRGSHVFGCPGVLRTEEQIGLELTAPVSSTTSLDTCLDFHVCVPLCYLVPDFATIN
jgi:hypothetical protein